MRYHGYKPGSMMVLGILMVLLCLDSWTLHGINEPDKRKNAGSRNSIFSGFNKTYPRHITLSNGQTIWALTKAVLQTTTPVLPVAEFALSSS